MTSARALWRSPALRYGLTIALIALILWKADPRQFWDTGRRLGPATLLPALALTVPFLLLKAQRWHLLLRAARSPATYPQALTSLLAGMGLALLTPARLGEITRAAYLPDPRKLRIAALVMVDKLYDVIILALLAIPGAALLLSPSLALLLAALAAAGILGALRPRTLRALYTPLGRHLPLYARIDRILADFAATPPATGLACLLATLASFALVLAQYWLLLHTLAPTAGPDIVLYCFPLVILTNILPLTVAGLGTREGAAILLLNHYHIPAPIAATSAFLMFTLNTALPGLLGAALTPLLRIPTAPAPHTAAQAPAPGVRRPLPDTPPPTGTRP